MLIEQFYLTNLFKEYYYVEVNMGHFPTHQAANMLS